MRTELMRQLNLCAVYETTACEAMDATLSSATCSLAQLRLAQRSPEDAKLHSQTSELSGAEPGGATMQSRSRRTYRCQVCQKTYDSVREANYATTMVGGHQVKACQWCCDKLYTSLMTKWNAGSLVQESEGRRERQ